MRERGAFKYIAGYALFREWRWHRHQEIKKQEFAPQYTQPVGYGGWILMALIFTGIFAIPLACFWYLPSMATWCILMILGAWCVAAWGCRLRWKEKHG